jgi:hypothetical protein
MLAWRQRPSGCLCYSKRNYIWTANMLTKHWRVRLVLYQYFSNTWPVTHNMAIWSPVPYCLSSREIDIRYRYGTGRPVATHQIYGRTCNTVWWTALLWRSKLFTLLWQASRYMQHGQRWARHSERETHSNFYLPRFFWRNLLWLITQPSRVNLSIYGNISYIWSVGNFFYLTTQMKDTYR